MATKKKAQPTKTASNRPSRLALGESLDLEGVVKLHARLVKCAAKKTNVCINAARVAYVDTSSLQALVSFVCLVSKNGNSVKWVTPSPALVNAARLASVDGALGLDSVAGN